MNLWDLKSSFYSHLRKKWPFRQIINRENANVLALLSELNMDRMRALDIGCGNGNSLQLLPENVKIIGLDLSWEMIKRARLHLQHLFVQGDARFLPFQPSCADLVISIGLLEYLPDWRYSLKCMADLVKSHGYLLITTSPPNIFCCLRRFYGIPLRSNSPEKVISAATSFGLSLIKKDHSTMQDQYLFQKRL